MSAIGGGKRTFATSSERSCRVWHTRLQHDDAIGFGMKAATEKELDRELDKALAGSAEFADWFLARTSFAGNRGARVWSRSDNPWGRIPMQVSDPVTRTIETVVKESETDILVVYQLDNGTRVGLHIENKVGLGKFRPNQADFYAQRARAWAGVEKYGNYSAWGTVLVAPEGFRGRFPEESAKFDAFISHEDIAQFVPLFDPGFGDTWLAAVQGHFDTLIHSTMTSYPMAESVAPPTLTEAAIRNADKAYLPVNGMHGGFSYWLDDTGGGEKRLIVESWCRVLEGSGLRHAITPAGAVLLDEGFV